jgi:hypothetical protein
MLTLQIPKLSDDTWLHMFLMNAQFPLWWHDGGEQWTSTIMGINPDTGIWVVILTNQSDVELDALLEKAYTYGVKLNGKIWG